MKAEDRTYLAVASTGLLARPNFCDIKKDTFTLLYIGLRSET
jgi:hypothetical protein